MTDMHWGKLGLRSKGDSFHIRVNLMSLAGALMGLICLIIPWGVLTVTNTGVTPPAEFEKDFRLGQHVDFYSDDLHFHLFAVVAFFLGLALASLTPLGGIGMAVGALDFYGGVQDAMNQLSLVHRPPDGLYVSISWDSGFHVAVAATVVVVASAILPIGFGYSEMYSHQVLGRRHLKERLLVWGRNTRG